MILARRLKRYVLVGVLAFSVISIALFLYITLPDGDPVPAQKLDVFLEIAKDGDIICRLGDRFWSHTLKDFSIEDKRYSHSGILRIHNGRITVIHSEGTANKGNDFVKEEPLEDFYAIARAIGIYRSKDIDGYLVSNMAIEYLGVPFDWQFDSEDESKLYCTELIHVVLKRLNPASGLKKTFVKTLNKEIIPLESISRSDNFSEIYYLNSEKQ